jgi:ATP-dependent DNA helicase DinG
VTEPSVEVALEIAVSALPTSEVRPGQLAMAQAVAIALRDRRHLVVQAGTGTGKTLAYLVPAFLSGHTIVITTATKALQDQLADKDLPLLVQELTPVLGRDISWAVLKGRSNYLCRQRVTEIEDRNSGAEAGSAPESLFELDDMSEANRREVVRLVEWGERTATGDRAELTWSTTDASWRAVSVGSDECPGASKCPSGESCFAELARFHASEADIIVVNTHLYGAHVASGGALLPEHEFLVVDEAHGLEDTMSDSVAISLGPGRLNFLAAALRRIIDDAPLMTRLGHASDALGEQLSPLVGNRLSIPLPADIVDTLVDLRGIAMDSLEILRKVDSKDEPTQQRRLRAQSLSSRLVEDLDKALGITSSSVPFVSGFERNARLDIAPLDVGPVLRESVWSKTTAILTSATVPANLPTRIGLDLDSTDTLLVESPFDYRTQSMLYCAAHMPNPNDSGFTDAMHEELRILIEAAGGRTLALFTSYRALDAAVEAIRPKIPFTVLSQREYQKNHLVSMFSQDESSCLFATSGFFQGIDIPGRTLSLVTIDRIPFPRPDDPLLSARREAVGTSAFRDIDIPRAATLLAQATGRLIRGVLDRGVVAVFDPRLAKAGYRRDILQALPNMKRSIDRDEVVDFLRTVTA